VAKLDAQKDVPIVRILDAPSLPTVKSGPKRASMIVIITVMAFFTIFLIVVIMEAVRRQKNSIWQDSYMACREDFSRAFPRTSRLIEISKSKELQSVDSDSANLR